MTIEKIVENSDISKEEKDALLKQLEVLNSIAETLKLTKNLTSELIPIISKHLEQLDTNHKLYYDKISMYTQSVLSIIRAVTPYHGHID